MLSVPENARLYAGTRSEEHTSELQSRLHLVCRLLLEKKNTTSTHNSTCVPSCSCETIFPISCIRPPRFASWTPSFSSSAHMPVIERIYLHCSMSYCAY